MIMSFLSIFFNKNKKDDKDPKLGSTLTKQEILSQIKWQEKKMEMNKSLSRRSVSLCLLMIARMHDYTPEEIEALEKLAKKHGDIVKILEGNAKRYTEERFEIVLKELKRDGLIENGYDYSWFRWLIQHDSLMFNLHLKTKSDEAYCNYLKSLGIEDVPDRSVIYRYYKLMDCNNPPYTPPFLFQDCINDPQERERRNTLIMEFLKMMMA